MFEKEAEEYFENECMHSYADTEEQLKEDVVPAFQKGAEFGYNKAKEEMQEQGLALQSDRDKTIEQNIALKKQIEKMKSDVMANIKWADKHCDNMWQKLVKMWNQWESK